MPSRKRGPARAHRGLAGKFALSQPLGVGRDDTRRCGDVPQRTRALDLGSDYDRIVTCDRRNALQRCVVCYAFFGKHEEAAAHIERARAITVEARLLQGQTQAREVAATAALLHGDIVGAREIRIAMYLDDC